MLVKIGLEGECFPTKATIIRQKPVDTISMCLQAAFTGGFIWTLVTVIPDFLVFRLVVPSQIVLIGKLFITGYTLKLLNSQFIVTLRMNGQT